jgi:GntR family transcriptional regulator
MTERTASDRLTVVIAHQSEEPIYEQIKRQFRQSIMTGLMQEGDSLPSLRQLAKELRVSVVTINRAYEDLEKEGFIVTAAGRGAFVAKVSKESLKDKKLKLVEEKLMESIELAESYGISRADFIKMIDLLFPRQKHG